MHPVGVYTFLHSSLPYQAHARFATDYYDLSVAGLPVHATAFRPIEEEALLDNPFRIFTSLLRFDLIKDPETRQLAEDTLEDRCIVSGTVLELLDRSDRQGGLTEAQVQKFINGVLETFRWHIIAKVNAKDYERLAAASPLCADVVSFAGPHINRESCERLEGERCTNWCAPQILPLVLSTSTPFRPA